MQPGEIAVNTTRLVDLQTGNEAIITKVLGRGAFRKRILEMGFIQGKKIKVIKNAPLLDPIQYNILGYDISLRRSEAALIEVVTSGKAPSGQEYHGTIDEDILKQNAREKSKHIRIALVGNPNSGKTSLYNFVSGKREHVGNYSGVTVDARKSTIQKDGYSIELIDLPGTYSITEYTPEEVYVRNHIIESNPDIVINVVDGSNLERNLYLTTQLIDLNIKVIIALNMSDEMEKNGDVLDDTMLGKLLGIPIIPTVSSRGQGLDELLKKVIQVYEDKDPTVRHIHIDYGNVIEKSIRRIQLFLKENRSLADKYSTRYLAIKLIEKDSICREIVQKLPNAELILAAAQEEINHLENEYLENSETIITDAKYGFISGALAETFSHSEAKKNRKLVNLDDLLTHRYWGFPIFIFFMWLMFQATFTIGNYPMEWIDAGVSHFSDFIASIMTEGPLKDLLIDGIIGGVGGVIVFLPNILILFFFISFMEDTGYMARASFIMDKLMHKIGLHGKSFIPVVMGFGCNVPAIMATRTLENKKDRIITMMIIPFMSCSARLPVYVLLISAFFPDNQGLVLASVYFIGILLAIIVAMILKKVMFNKQDIPFVMELPPYRIPTLRNTSIHMWYKGAQYLKKMGSVILIASIIIWALGYYPRNIELSRNFEQEIAMIHNSPSLSADEISESVHALKHQWKSELQEKSYIGQTGHFLEPVLTPLGFDWKIGVSILTGMAAKEIVVSTIAVLYQADEGDDELSGSIGQKLKEQVHMSGPLAGQPVFSPLVAFGLMLFILIYFPCIAVIAAIKKEGNWGWAIFTMFYTTLLAWLMAFASYQLGNLLI